MNKIFIDYRKDIIIAIKLHNDTLKDFFVVNMNNIVDNIYIGRVENVRGNRVFINFDEQRKNGIMRAEDNKYKSGDYIRCQVKRDECGDKGAVLTDRISLAGRYVVLVDGIDGYKYSHRLSQEDIERLQNNLADISNQQIGYIVRSQATNADPIAVADEVGCLWNEYNSLLSNSYSNRIQCIYEKNLLDLLLSEMQAYDCSIVINSTRHLQQYHHSYQIYDELLLMHDFYNLNKYMEEILSRKVLLQNGAELVFDITEAMTVIDVNSKSAVGSVSYINKLAAIEILKQIRWRNISGLIVIDFITQPNSQKLLDFINKELKKDKNRARALALKEYSIIAINRKKRYNAFNMFFYEECDTCQNGWKLKDTFLCYQICQQAINLYAQDPYKRLLISINNRLHKVLSESIQFYLMKILHRAKIYIKNDNVSSQNYTISIVDEKTQLENADLIQEVK